jgi:class 3 adenylate cyclase
VGAIEYAMGAGGSQVAWREVGGAGPAIVYASGAMVPIEVMEDDPIHARFLRGLAELGRLYVFDRRGIGASDPPDWGQPLLPQWTDDCLTVLDAAQIDAAVLVGYEAGASVALSVAGRRPERVSRLVLFHGPAGDAESWRQVVEGWKTRMAAIAARDLDQGRFMLEAAAPSRVDDPAFRAWVDRAGRIGASPGTAGRIWSSIFETSPEERAAGLNDVRTPTLVLHRADCQVLPLSGSRTLAALLPDARLVVLPGADLIPYAGDVDALLAEISVFVAGEHRARAPDRAMLAVLFTDIVGSTEQATSSGDATWRGVLDHHDQMVRSALGRHGGTLVKTTGDGILATFDSASRALAGATDLRAALADIGLQVRVGIHVGEVERRGEDVAGLAVHVAARIMSQAAAGQILVSGAVAQVAAGGLHQFTTLARRALKGLQGEWDVLSLVPGAVPGRRSGED